MKNALLAASLVLLAACRAGGADLATAADRDRSGLGGPLAKGEGAFPGPCVVRTDVGPDGTVDDRATWTYDAEGRFVALESAKGEDGPVTDRTTFGMDGNGELVLEEVDWGADGTVDMRTRTSYGPGDGDYAQEDDWDGDGTADYCLRSSRTRDEERDELVQVQLGDDACDGTVEGRTVFTYGAAGLLRHERQTPAGAPQGRTVFTYDEDGRMQRAEEDRDGDGTVDRRTTYSYDGHGRASALEEDGGERFGAPDGRADLRTTYTHDEKGNLVAEERDGDAQTGRAADGTPDVRVTYDYSCWGAR